MTLGFLSCRCPCLFKHKQEFSNCSFSGIYALATQDVRSIKENTSSSLLLLLSGRIHTRDSSNIGKPPHNLPGEFVWVCCWSCILFGHFPLSIMELGRHIIVVAVCSFSSTKSYNGQHDFLRLACCQACAQTCIKETVYMIGLSATVWHNWVKEVWLCGCSLSYLFCFSTFFFLYCGFGKMKFRSDPLKLSYVPSWVWDAFAIQKQQFCTSFSSSSSTFFFLF